MNAFISLFKSKPKLETIDSQPDEVYKPSPE